MRMTELIVWEDLQKFPITLLLTVKISKTAQVLCRKDLEEWAGEPDYCCCC